MVKCVQRSVSGVVAVRLFRSGFILPALIVSALGWARLSAPAIANSSLPLPTPSPLTAPSPAPVVVPVRPDPVSGSDSIPANQTNPTPIAPASPVPSPVPFPGIHNQPGAILELTPQTQRSQTTRLEIRLSQRRVTLYRGDAAVKSYPIAIGRSGWETPKGEWVVRQMLKDPVWIHPLKKGVVIPGGDPENPLGRYWIGFWTDGKNWIGFHGTPNPRSVGSAASHGCVRMYNKDIEELFKQVSLGTVVRVVQ